MIGLAGLLRPIVSRLHARRAPFAVIGGLAVSVRTVPRFTKDVDLAVAVSSDADAERLVFEIARDGYEVVTLVEQTSTGRLATARLGLTGEDSNDAVLDLLFASSGIEPEVVAAAQPVNLFPGLVTPIAQTGHLIALKVLSRNDETRPQDLIDLHALLSEATEEDLELARAALDLIAQRGYDRGKSLQSDLDALIARFRPTD